MNNEAQTSKQRFALLCLFSFLIQGLCCKKMLGDNLKIFVHGLPLDCEEHSLKDFLEGEYVILQLKGETLIFFYRLLILPYPKKLP